VPLSQKEALALAKYCRKNEIYFDFYQFYKVGTFNLNAKFEIPDDLAHAHGFYTQEEFEEIMKAGGPYYIGRVTLNKVRYNPMDDPFATFRVGKTTYRSNSPSDLSKSSFQDISCSYMLPVSPGEFVEVKELSQVFL